MKSKLCKLLALTFAVSMVAVAAPAQASYWTYGYYHPGCCACVPCCHYVCYSPCCWRF